MQNFSSLDKSNNKTKSSAQTSSSSLSSPTKTNRSKEDNKKVGELKRKICQKVFNNNLIANENESNNVLASSLNDDELKITQNTPTAECDCSSCVCNRELDELEKNNQQLSNGIRRLKKTLTPKKLTTESISNSSSGNSSDSSMLSSFFKHSNFVI